MSKIPHQANELFDVTSLEKDRVYLIEEDGKLLVSKKTSVKEFKNLIKAEQRLKNANTFQGKKTGLNFLVTVPKIVEWNESNNTLTMEYCSGVNIERELIKNDIHRGFYINLLSDLLEWMREESFYWQGFAPRNLLLRKDINTITLVDFESNLKLGRGIMSVSHFNFFLQDRIILELATILFPHEQMYLCPNVWNYYKKAYISLEKVDGRRRRQYLLNHYPNISKISHRDLVQTERSIVQIASPFNYEGTIFYPLIELSKIKSVERYVQTVCALENIEQSMWPEVINRAVAKEKYS